MSVQVVILHVRNARSTTSHNPEISHEAYFGDDRFNGSIASATMAARLETAYAEKHKQSIEPHQQLQE